MTGTHDIAGAKRVVVKVGTRVVTVGEDALSEEHIERPTSTLAEHCLVTRHVDLVHIRAFFPVQFDADEVLVQEGGNLLVLE